MSAAGTIRAVRLDRNLIEATTMVRQIISGSGAEAVAEYSLVSSAVERQRPLCLEINGV